MGTDIDKLKIKAKEAAAAIGLVMEEDPGSDVNQQLDKARRLSALSANAAQMVGWSQSALLQKKGEIYEEQEGKGLQVTELRILVDAGAWEETALFTYVTELSKNLRAAIDLIRTDVSKYKEELHSSHVAGSGP